MNKNRLFPALFVAILLVVEVHAQHSRTGPQQFNYNVDLERVGTSKQRILAVDSLLQSFVDQKRVPNVTAFVAKAGNVVYKKSFGLKDMERNIPATPDDYYILFSQTKAITTVAFMTLVEKGLVNIDDPVSKYFPGISDRVVTEVRNDGTYETRPAAGPVTFVHLMSHSSGLNAGLSGNIRRIEKRMADSVRKAKGDTLVVPVMGQRTGGAGTARYLKDEMIALAKYPLGFDPGSEWNYHISTNMLAYMVERISGKSLRQYVKETILEPLGMSQTDWYYSKEKLGRFVKVYNYVNGKLEPAPNNYSEATVSKEQTYVEGAIGLNGPIEDYAKFCQMLLNGGTFNGHSILKPETIHLMTKVNRLPEVNAGGKGFQFGLGFELYNEHKKPAPEVSNTAYSWGGLFGTEYIIDPEKNMITLFYLNMARKEALAPLFISKAYQLFEE
ncbi:serine hydrolase domain-containing protein [Niabella yanshanensis]|uniref:Serine hydrolase domain-containing protein n=1 Tax=Niabella yanshanensis TaxID=577386 RepID=A0ABZ0W7B8_9BACT|nr:serine hydrolase domain-containing protein [Niabella yanshanensis]WQD38010.1 serine hydrolase domain-containing protein [Niabella yanshanensis]